MKQEGIDKIRASGLKLTFIADRVPCNYVTLWHMMKPGANVKEVYANRLINIVPGLEMSDIYGEET